MSKSKGGLGRGLAALIPTGPATNTVNAVFMQGPPKKDDAASTTASDAAESTSATAATAAEKANDAAPASEADGATATATPPVEESPTDSNDSGAMASAAVTSSGGPGYFELPIDQIRPNARNPRTVFDEDALAELEHSLREFGLLQPIVVRPVDDGYELVMGERRWRAAQQAGLTTIPAIVRRTEDADMLRDALLENIHRTNLNPLEEAAAYQQLLEEFEVTQEELASRIGRSRPVISNTIRLLKLPVAVQRRVAAGVLSAGHARALLGLEEPAEQEDLAARIVAEGLSVRGTEEAVVLMAGKSRTKKRAAPKKLIMPGLSSLAEKLSDAFDTRVRVELGRQKGRVVVEFATVDDLHRIIQIMSPEALPPGLRNSAPPTGSAS
ncbi:ParB/RepB/Spo0J family partition protein [Nakamurella sp. YIM 132087]|uniref:ParB/RepB/Spo0J family partition protein n=1 Tax=Nakamurella alba TaxID=2665158 RepID=A0A7K1FLG9_9ACTN|nr:ParB/RepB/Spo0J family partition protein [Nakamurella alba]MTD14985.1 ParB/RepB/Spo0J family partition protein [Nakamurella alba]